MGDQYKKLKLAAVQAAPVFLDREATVEKACQLIREAGKEGCDVIGFPEGFIASHPGWVNFITVQGDKSLYFCREIFKNAVEIPSVAVEKLQRACREANITAVVGLNEKEIGSTGTLWNSQLFIDRNGEIIGKRRKLVPTLGERVIHAPGDADSARAYQTHFGAISGLICGENSNPLAAFALSVSYPVVHVAAWPAHFNRGMLMQDSILIATQGLAYQLKAFVINSCAIVTDDLIEAYAETDEDRNHLKGLQKLGGASIIGPSGKIIAQKDAGEGLVFADVDLQDVIIPKFVHDFAGHYNRADIFSLSISKEATSLLNGRVPAAGGMDHLLRDPGKPAIGNDLLQLASSHNDAELT